MSPRHRYTIAGIAWALLVGPAVCLLLGGFAGGASWLWLFGDDPWPQAMRWVLPLIAASGGALSALVCVVAAYRYGKSREALPAASERAERRRALILAATPLAILLLLGLDAWRESREYPRDTRVAKRREAAFAALASACHRIAAIGLDHRADGQLRATVRMRGEREGEYRLSWQVVDTGFGAALATGDMVIRLKPGEDEAEIAFTLDLLARRYRAKVLRRAGGALIDEPFRLEAHLAPLLRQSERSALPTGVEGRLETAESRLSSQMNVPFPVRFFIRRDGSIGK